MALSPSLIEMTSFTPLNEAPSSSPEPRKVDKLESLARKWFIAKRDFSYVSSFSVSSLRWLKTNKNYQSALPIFWRDHPPFQAGITPLFETHSEELSRLVKYYISEKKLKPAKIAKHLSKIIESHGCCHGQSLAILERIRSNPDWDPETIIDELQRQPERILYFQVLEIIRGLCNEKMHALKESPQKLAPHEEIDNRLTSCHPKSIRLIFLGSPISKKNTLFESMQKELSLHENATLTVRCWNNIKSTGHTLLFRCSVETSRYWFYNSAWLGVYEYPTKEALKKGFIEHLKTLIPSTRASTKIYYLLETYSDEAEKKFKEAE